MSVRKVMNLKRPDFGHFSAQSFFENLERGNIIKMTKKSTQNYKPRFKRSF
ncbi:hypothetical protein M5D96_007506 [Drosophila gunungcola]|uniref:Uncharacterized protein n=1 Tax=Drosophila gunungcola TaxID=103775 RepID=A0A9P9YNN9_9MUSC|nr:hypothetical protein M5D96_007506 [Drosophila gunungcola]